MQTVTVPPAKLALTPVRARKRAGRARKHTHGKRSSCARGGATHCPSIHIPSMAAVSSDVVLSPIEAARMAAVIEETLEKLSLLTAISPDILMHRDEVAEMTSGEISRLITEQRALEAKYESLVAARAMMKGAGNKSRLKDLQTEIQTVSYQLRESMKGLCRSLRVCVPRARACMRVRACVRACVRCGRHF
ncbi:hypothetical protein EON66_02695 [archaeon]|nr:MAG: hypothetical protein EON66_02695 [archaeon]